MGSPCFRDEVVYFLLHGDDELGACCLNFFCVAGVVFRVEQGIDRIRAHDVRVGQCVVIVVIGGEYGWWVFFAVHDCAECFRDGAYVVWFVEVCLAV